MESKVVVANHKMNLTVREISDYLKKISKINNKNVIICPTSIYAPYFLQNGYSVGLQNISYKEKVLILEKYHQFKHLVWVFLMLL